MCEGRERKYIYRGLLSISNKKYVSMRVGNDRGIDIGIAVTCFVEI